MMKRPSGFVTISKILLPNGKEMSTQEAVDRGWIAPVKCKTTGWDLQRHEIPLGSNLFLDQGRQCNAYAFGLRSPIENYGCAKVGFGIGTTAPNVTQTGLITPVPLDTGANPLVYTKDINGVDFPAPFIARVEYTIGFNDCNGFLITEQGLFTDNNTLIARKVNSVGINKTSDFSPTLTWRIRF